MRKKQPWMAPFAKVLADGQPGTIIKFQYTTIDDVDYVSSFFVRLDGSKFAKRYHPDSVEEDTKAVTYIHR